MISNCCAIFPKISVRADRFFQLPGTRKLSVGLKNTPHSKTPQLHSNKNATTPHVRVCPLFLRLSISDELPSRINLCGFTSKIWVDLTILFFLPFIFRSRSSCWSLFLVVFHCRPSRRCRRWITICSPGCCGCCRRQHHTRVVDQSQSA